MKRCPMSLLFVAWFIQTGALRAENWTQFRGPNATGVANGPNIPSKFGENDGILWKVAIPGLGNSSPIIWDRYVFLQTSSKDAKARLMLCLDAKTGKEVWSRSLPGTTASFNRINSLASSTPVTDGEGVYAAVWDGRDVTLVAYSFQGELLWKRNLGPFISQHGPGASPILFRDKVIFAYDMDKEDKNKRAVARPSILMALDKKTGEVVWEKPREAYRACYSIPLLREATGAAPELIVTSTSAITSYNPDDGSTYWEWTWKFKSKMPLRTVASSLLTGDMLFAMAGDGGGDRHMAALGLAGAGKSTTVTPMWENRKDFPYVPCILSRNGYIYQVSDKDFAGCYDARTGKRVWLERHSGANFTASPILIDARIFAASEEGDVYVLSALPKYQLLAKNSLGEMIRATPAVADGRLYIRGQNHLYCIGKK